MKNSGKINPIEVQKFLKKIDYPASKQEIIDCAKDNGTPKEVINEIESIKGK